MHAARSVSAGDGRRINDDFNGTLYIAWALGVTSPLERELFISAERQRIFQLFAEAIRSNKAILPLPS